MVDIFVDNVTTFELVFATTTVVVDHLQRVAVLVVNHVAFSVANDRSSFASCLSRVVEVAVGIWFRQIIFIVVRIQEVTVVLVVVSINALEAETINTTQRVSHLNTLQRTFVGALVVELSINRVKHRGIHLSYLIDILRDVETEVSVELTELQNVGSADKEFPTLVGHLTNVGAAQ